MRELKGLLLQKLIVERQHISLVGFGLLPLRLSYSLSNPISFGFLCQSSKTSQPFQKFPHCHPLPVFMWRTLTSPRLDWYSSVYASGPEGVQLTIPPCCKKSCPLVIVILCPAVLPAQPESVKVNRVSSPAC